MGFGSGNGTMGAQHKGKKGKVITLLKRLEERLLSLRRPC